MSEDAKTKAAAVTTSRFVVYKANIKDDNDVKYGHGEVITLSPKLAKHYNKLGYLRPYMDDSSDNGNSV